MAELTAFNGRNTPLFYSGNGH